MRVHTKKNFFRENWNACQSPNPVKVVPLYNLKPPFFVYFNPENGYPVTA